MTMKYTAILVLTCFTASLFSMDGGATSGDRTRAHLQHTMVFANSIIPHIENHTLTLEAVQAFLNRSSTNHDADSSFCNTYRTTIQKYAAQVEKSSTPTIDQIEHACASLLLLAEIESDQFVRMKTRNQAVQLFLTQDTFISRLINAAETASDAAGIKNGLRALALLEIFIPGDDTTALIDEKRPLLQQQLAKVGTKKGPENQGDKPDRSGKGASDDQSNDISNSFWTAAFTPKRLMTIGGIALIAAAVYYFGYAKKDAKGAKANPQPKK